MKTPTPLTLVKLKFVKEMWNYFNAANNGWQYTANADAFITLKHVTNMSELQYR